MSPFIFYAASALAQIAASAFVHALSTAGAALGSPVQKELAAPRGVWRPLSHPFMLYPLLGQPLVSAVLLHQVTAALRVPSVAGDVAAGCRLAALLWAAGAAHGILINYSSLKVSFAVTLHFLLTTLLLALVNGALFAYFSV